MTGPHATAEVMDAVHQHVPKPHDPFVDLGARGARRRASSSRRHYAYLKISEGCNHRCFCIIPSMRGDLSRARWATCWNEAQRLFESA